MQLYAKFPHVNSVIFGDGDERLESTMVKQLKQLKQLKQTWEMYFAPLLASICKAMSV
jgi:hypothetical protein